MSKQINESSVAWTILNLVIFTLVAAVIAFSFGFASFSFLDTGRDTLVVSHIAKAGIEFPYQRSAFAQYTERGAAPVAAVANQPGLVGIKIPFSSTAQNLMTSDMLSQGLGSTWNYESPSAREASQTTQESWHASLTEGVPTDETVPPRVSESQRTAPRAMPGAEAAIVSLGASSNALPGISLPNEERARLAQTFQIQHAPPPQLDQTAVSSHDTALAKPVYGGHSDEHPLSSKAAFRYRVRKECGPITDLELRHQCISSFGYR